MIAGHPAPTWPDQVSLASKLSRALRHPLEAGGMILDRYECARDERPTPAPNVPSTAYDEALASFFVEADVVELLADPGLAALEAQLAERVAARRATSPYPSFYNASLPLARASWVACRLTGAQTVVETGVAAGFSTSFLLHALARNGGGQLHSIDVAPYTVDPRSVGWLVPSELRSGWTLHRGRSQRVLAPLVRNLGAIDLFQHDGLHTQATMRFELRVGGGAVRAGGVVLCDDAQMNLAFTEWAREARARWTLARRGTGAYRFGLARIVES